MGNHRPRCVETTCQTVHERGCIPGGSTHTLSHILTETYISQKKTLPKSRRVYMHVAFSLSPFCAAVTAHLTAHLKLHGFDWTID